MLKRLLFGEKKESSAKMAKDRLQIIIAHQRGDGKPSVDMEALEEDILLAIKRHIDIDMEDFEISLDDGELDISIDLSKARERNEKDVSKQEGATNSNTKPKHMNHNKKKK